MANYQVNLTETASGHLRSLAEYIEVTFGSDKSNQVLTGIFSHLESISQYPDIGKKSEKIIPWLTGYRLLITDKNTILYRVQAEDKTIKIIAILDNRSDLQQRIKDILEK